MKIEASFVYEHCWQSLHSYKYSLRYISAAVCGFREAQRRAISIEVGMQNSSLGVVLATSHFTSPMVALHATLSTVIMNIMGSSLAFFVLQMTIPKLHFIIII
ncbi:hypothetical protein L3X38_009231 [Prunus dulcis]|uniref:Sodium Bile acid symporter family n=1 Tax=Prunus dulcis TaxID=3755 RepID=A0AAD4ZY57_PRUDU|nr:hypothetical protein L3X38_009231 [Prunus dulcis]